MFLVVRKKKKNELNNRQIEVQCHHLASVKIHRKNL